MRFNTRTTLILLTLGILVGACSKDNVAPSTETGVPTLAGSLGDYHPSLEQICQTPDTLFFCRSYGVGTTVDRCFGMYGEITCPANQPKWGYALMQEGYYGGLSYIDCNFKMATGWFIDSVQWFVGQPGTLVFDPATALPVRDAATWTIEKLNPMPDEYRLRIPTNSIPGTSFSMAARIRVMKIPPSGIPRLESATDLWAINRNWSKVGDAQLSSSPYLAPFRPQHCMEVAPPDTVRLVKAVYTGMNYAGSTQNMATLSPWCLDSGTLSYKWNTGATTQQITVAPTVNTTYDCTISVNAVPKHIVEYGVKVIDISCSIHAGSHGSLHGSGNHGCRHDGSVGSHGSGSAHHIGCDHQHGNKTACNSTHEYGCNGQHVSGACNHKGHGYHCDAGHALNRSCNGGHTRGCTGAHDATQACTTTGGHNYRCDGQHLLGNCNSNANHADKCNGGAHALGKGCNDGHRHKTAAHGNGSGHGSGLANGHGSGSVQAQGVQICHVPPGHPEDAITLCVDYNHLSQHITGATAPNPGAGGSGSQGSKKRFGGHGSFNTGSGHGSGNHGHPVHAGDMLGACNSNPNL